jgi:hypothetical protein
MNFGAPLVSGGLDLPLLVVYFPNRSACAFSNVLRVCGLTNNAMT